MDYEEPKNEVDRSKCTSSSTWLSHHGDVNRYFTLHGLLNCVFTRVNNPYRNRKLVKGLDIGYQLNLTDCFFLLRDYARLARYQVEICLGVFGLGGVFYLLFQWGGFDGFTPGIAASALLMVLVLGWTATYLLRAFTGNMTYMQQRRDYRSAYDALTSEQLQARFDALSPEEQERLLREAGEA